MYSLCVLYMSCAIVLITIVSRELMVSNDVRSVCGTRQAHAAWLCDARTGCLIVVFVLCSLSTFAMILISFFVCHVSRWWKKVCERTRNRGTMCLLAQSSCRFYIHIAPVALRGMRAHEWPLISVDFIACLVS